MVMKKLITLISECDDFWGIFPGQIIEESDIFDVVTLKNKNVYSYDQDILWIYVF